MRLNHLKMIHRWNRMCHVPLHLSKDQRSQLNRTTIGRHITCAHKNIKLSHMIKIKAIVRVYKEYANKKIAKIFNRVLSPYLHTHTHTHVRTCAHTHTHTRAHKHCVARGGLICHHVASSFSSMPHQLPRHQAIKNIFFIHFNSK